MALETKTRSNDKRKIRSATWLNGIMLIFLLVTSSACTNDYIALDTVITPIPTNTPAPTLIPTSIDYVLTQTPLPTTPPVLPTLTVNAGIGGGGNLLVPTLSMTDEPVVAAPEIATSQPTLPPVKNNPSDEPPLLYYTQAGDTMPGLSARFGVAITDIVPAGQVTESGFMDPNQLMMIPPRLKDTTSNLKLMPDSEVVFSPSGLDFDIDGFVENAGGYLSEYKEYLQSSSWIDGAGVIRKVAVENSINPRILLAILEYRSHWVYGQPVGYMETEYPLGHVDQFKKGLYFQLTWAVSQMNLGYYGWREGILTDVKFDDGLVLKAAPELNAGTFALQYLFAQMMERPQWESALYTENGFAALYNQMFSSPWLRSMTVEPLFPATLKQPELILPMEPGVEWNFTGGPHSAWGPEGARAALDFAPSETSSGCVSSKAWVLAAASGVVVRSGGGVVVLDLDGDGNEQTGWDLLYMHIATLDRVQVGDFLEQGQPIGHPSCEGGVSTGTHFHIARKYNGEWILAGGPLPFTMDGWVAQAAAQAYKGTISKGDLVIAACTCGTKDTIVVREDPNPAP